MKTIFLGSAFIMLAAGVGTPCNPVPKPTPRPTPISTPTGIPTQPIPTPQPPPPEPSTAIKGEAVIVLDARDFKPKPRENRPSDLDYYAGATFVWSLERGPKGPELVVPALEISLRGLDYEPCVSDKCASLKVKDRLPNGAEFDKSVGPHPMGIVARFSSSTEYDSQEPDEHKHLGEGIQYPHRLPVGAWPLVEVGIRWDETGVFIASLKPDGEIRASRKLTKGSPRVGFSKIYFPLPDSRGVGWSYGAFTFQGFKGKALLKSWRTIEAGELPSYR